MKKLVILLIKSYQRYLSGLKPPTCRFYPTCSTYCLQSIEIQGLWRGLWSGIKRVLRCHPLHPGGYDPPC